MQELKGCGLKRWVQKLLESSDFPDRLPELGAFSPRKIINPLFSFLYHTNDQVKWHAVTAMGLVVADLADRDMESARVILRRLMWNLNDESGGIGWGSAEAMGEILARHKGLATEYANILLSYIQEDGNFQEHELMQRGVLWGIGRLAEVRPGLLGDVFYHALPFLESPDPTKRGLASRLMGLLRAGGTRGRLMALTGDGSEFITYLDHVLVRCTVKEMATWAMECIDNSGM